jgi:hypothetical protein
MRTLSELIREGATKRGKTERGFFVCESNGEICSCALGAAFEAITGKPSLHLDPFLVDALIKRETGIDIRETCIRDPRSGYPRNLCGAIVSLNDYEGKSREEIADWLESIGY